MNLAPIALFTYNRLWHTRQTVEALIKNELAQRSDLIIYADGPQNDTARNSVAEVRKYIRTIDGFKSIRIVERKNNAGLANAIITGVSELIDEFGRVIVMEDDLVSSPHLLKFMNDGLAYYEAEDRVVSIHAYTYPLKEKLPETFFLKGADCWGWATWKRGWDVFEPDGSKLLAQIKAKKLAKCFDMDGVHPYTKMLKDQVTGKNNSWAVRWYASAFLSNKLTLYPGRCLVRNIGTDSSGTHCENVNYYDVSLADQAVQIGGIDIVESKAARKAFQKYMKSTRRKQIKSRIERIVDYFL
ncbi:MAG: glycosyltransferase [Desulfobacterales bacterium]|uniref:Glycosyltransferase n=1 Tax=Candidatus Desulfatibia vada TaxID=2841696 RepID=A0A8J6TL67_9BACT|nr:glycosyltransferase [Candidatus Desulfatibia vada]